MLFDLYGVLGRGPEVNEETFRLELFKLLSYVVGDRSVMELSQANPECVFQDLRREFFDNEVTGLLISTAVKGRLYDEYYDYIFKEMGGECGQLIFESGQRMPLSIREACNKILHARYHHWSTERSSNSVDYFVSLYGSHQGQKWQAELDIRKYVHYCATATMFSKKHFQEKQREQLDKKLQELKSKMSGSSSK
jgi:hypothetical protein